MSSGMRFEGKLGYEDRAAAGEAIARAKALLEEDDEDLRQLFADEPSWIAAAGETVAVSIDFSGPSDWWFSLEGMVEALVETATTGFVDAELEGADGKVRYHAGGEEEELD